MPLCGHVQYWSGRMKRLNPHTKDLRGKTFGRWRVLAFSHRQTTPPGTYWLCVCACGTFRRVKSVTLQQGATRSCGCAPRRSPRTRRVSLIDLTGMQFNWLTVIKLAGADKYGAAMWECQCRCGRTRICQGKRLKKGLIYSCGCRPRKPCRNRNPNAATRHPLYDSWVQMRQRCCNVRHINFHNYGGRGISVCPEWSSNFWQFVNDMGPRPEGYSLDRIDVNGPYSPENCRWADALTQRHNQRRWLSRLVESTCRAS